MKKIEHVANIQLTPAQMRPLRAAFKKIEEQKGEGKKAGSIAAQIFFDGSVRVVHLTARQVGEWQRYIGNEGVKRVTAGGSSFRFSQR